MVQHRGTQGSDLGDDPDDAQLAWIAALKSLARSRGIPLEVVLRAALRGDLMMVVMLPAERP